MLVGTMSVGGIASFLQKKRIFGLGFFNVTAFNFAILSILRWNWQKKIHKTHCIPLNILNIYLHMMAGNMFSTYMFTCKLNKEKPSGCESLCSVLI